jgi:hypothetical protein
LVSEELWSSRRLPPTFATSASAIHWMSASGVAPLRTRASVAAGALLGGVSQVFWGRFVFSAWTDLLYRQNHGAGGVTFLQQNFETSNVWQCFKRI